MRESPFWKFDLFLGVKYAENFKIQETAWK